MRAPLLAFLALPVLPQLVAVVPARTPLTKHVLFVVDVSGSMRDEARLRRACSAVLRIAEQPVDEVQIAVLAFNDRSTRWAGVPEPEGDHPVLPGWAALPSATALERAQAFLDELDARGETRVIPALTQALHEPRGELSLVLLSDGIFPQETAEEVLAAWERGARWRSEHELDPAVLLVYGVGPESALLGQLGQAGGGGYYREAPDPPIAAPVQGLWR